ncbi:MAG: phosphate signaling complex protein PhoU [Desulfobaccales bacterium]|nr:phosphate signaling complex protein PhoU [Desulfobaccales bacterium]
MGAETPKDEAPRADKFHREMEELKEKLLELARLAERAIERSLTAFLHADRDLARQVITGDIVINDLEEAIDSECVRLIALYQPVAIDLRQVMAVDHIITELERIGDSATNIAEEVLNLELYPLRPVHKDLPRMGENVLRMLRQSLKAFLDHDTRLAREVCRADDEVDALDRSIIKDLLKEMAAQQDAVPAGQCQINIVRNLERVGDHATNIAEQVVYMVEGESIRHRCQG